MATQEISGTTVEVNEEGYLTDPARWNREIAGEIAKEEGIENLDEAHWKVIEYLRKYHAENGTMPTIRTLKKAGVVPVKELYRLFPGGPLKKASRISGLPKPTSCV